MSAYCVSANRKAGKDMQQERYIRQMTMPQIGREGQEKISEAKILVIGAGGLGSPVIYYLAGCGVGTLGIADGDTVSVSNLHRQIIHDNDSVGVNKAVSAANTAKRFDPDIKTVTYEKYLDSKDISDIIKDYDFIIDATDGAENKFMINDACVMADKPFVHAGILRSGGQIMTVLPHKTSCLRCVFEEIPQNSETCAEAGIIGMTCGIAGSIQAAEAVKYILGTGDMLTDCMMSFDCFSMKFRRIPIGGKNDDCRVCGKRHDICDLSMYEK